jgi:hypothetical protein
LLIALSTTIKQVQKIIENETFHVA